MWIVFAFLSAIFAGITAILAKIGLKDTDSTLATAMRTVVVLAFSLILVFSTGAIWQLGAVTLSTLFFLILSGAATGASWLCYFKALQMGEVNKVVPIDKSSTILAMLLGIFVLGETENLPVKLIGMALIALGTVFMLLRENNPSQESEQEEAGKEPAPHKLRHRWWVYAALSAFFAALTSILGKIGVEDVDSNLGTAIRTLVVLLMAWLMVFYQNKQGQVKSLTGRSLLFIVLSGLATGLSWLCYYYALQKGYASVVVPIDKLSILVTVCFSTVILKEKMQKRAWIGLGVLTLGTLVLLLKF